MIAYYNEIDPNAAAWLRELIREGRIAPGDVDERSILDVKPDDLRAYTQCHFFAGIGVWSHALRCAGWPDGRPVWTGSCPCQPFSAAGKRGGTADERHLWPAWQWLVGQCRPDVVLGEQVASKDGLAWLDLVRTDLEGTDYAVGFFDLCAAGFGAPHIRQRLYFSARSMAEPAGERWERRRSGETRAEPGTVERPERLCASGGLADDDDTGLEGRRQPGRERRIERVAGTGVVAGGLAVSDGAGSGARKRDDQGTRYGHPATATPDDDRQGFTGPVNGFWRDADWLGCRDDKWRPVEPGTFPLAHGAAARVGRLRGYGNAIVAPQAEVFVEAYLAAERDGFVRLGDIHADVHV